MTPKSTPQPPATPSKKSEGDAVTKRRIMQSRERRFKIAAAAVAAAAGAVAFAKA